MSFKTFPIAAAVFTLTLGSTNAATIPAAPTFFIAMIQSHNAHSSFLPGGYKLGVDILDDGPSGLTNSSTAEGLEGSSLLQISNPQSKPPEFSTPSSNYFPSGSNNPPATEASGASGGSLSSTSVGSAAGSASPPESIGTVPLPPAFPMFGAALLMLGTLGYGLRRRTAARPF